MDADRIREALVLRGYSLTRVARAIDYSPALISYVINRKRINHRAALAVATALGKPIERIFPDIPMYHGPLMSDEERDLKLVRQLEEQGVIRRSA